MSATVATPAIAVEQLRVGMYVHLDVGWLAHPFPLSSFRIDRPEQIDTIRALGLAQVRWSPALSEPAAGSAAGDAARTAAAAPADAALPVDDAPPEAAGLPPAETALQAEQRRRREALAAERAALALCERQYAEAAREWRRSAELVGADPGGARERTEALARALVDKMLAQPETCIRLLGIGAGDRAGAHALNVTLIALVLARLLGLDADTIAELGVGALLHDIGKLDLPDRVRHADEAHSAAEVRLYREHVAHGVTQGRRMGLATGALLVIAQHHEQADGSGFPQQLDGARMTPAARIVALVNRYDNLCNPLQPGRAKTPHEALSLLYAQRARYGAEVINGFVRMMGVYPPGSVVQLSDDRWALVTSVNAARPLKPRVLVHDRRVARDEALHLDLERESALGIRRAVKPQQLPPEALQYLAPAPRLSYFFEAAPARDDDPSGAPA
jgi:putative nucleotidyltransferase with HDIG domain